MCKTAEMWIVVDWVFDIALDSISQETVEWVDEMLVSD